MSDVRDIDEEIVNNFLASKGLYSNARYFPAAGIGVGDFYYVQKLLLEFMGKGEGTAGKVADFNLNINHHSVCIHHSTSPRLGNDNLSIEISNTTRTHLYELKRDLAQLNKERMGDDYMCGGLVLKLCEGLNAIYSENNFMVDSTYSSETEQLL